MAAENVLRHTEFFSFQTLMVGNQAVCSKNVPCFPLNVLLCVVVVLISGLGLNFPAESYASMFACGTRISKL